MQTTRPTDSLRVKGRCPLCGKPVYRIEVALDIGVKSGMRAATGSRDDTE